MPLSPSPLMAPIPQFHSNYHTVSTDLITDFPTANTSIMEENTLMWGRECHNNFNISDLENGALDDHIAVSLDYCDNNMSSSSPLMPITFSEQLGSINNSHDDLAIMLAAISSDSNNKMGFYHGAINAGFQNFMSSGILQPHNGDEFGDQDIKPPNTTATENWGIQGNQMSAGEEPNNIKVERYSEEERKEKILRYLKKRNQRNFNKTIKYACRKTLADRRVRVRGRFARNNELSEEDMASKKHENIHHKQDLYGDDSIQFQLRNDEEDWLQEAMANLVYLSHSSPADI